jgi:hypothetical protein
MKTPAGRKYTCNEYREEMRLLGLRRRLEQQSLSEDERAKLVAEIESLERAMAMD